MLQNIRNEIFLTNNYGGFGKVTDKLYRLLAMFDMRCNATEKTTSFTSEETHAHCWALILQKLLQKQLRESFITIG